MSFGRLCMTGLALLVWAGCSHTPGASHGPGANPASAPRTEHVYLLPLEETLLEAQTLLQERRLVLEPFEGDPHRLISSWVQHAPDSVLRTRERYLLVGIQVAPKQSVVRVFRLTDVSIPGGTAEVASYSEVKIHPDKIEMDPFTYGLEEPRTLLRGTRDEAIEQELTRRLESRPSIEIVGDRAPELPLTPRRDENFYLQRWKEPARVSLCENWLRDAKELLRPGQTVLVGEQLGTREVPALVGDLACQAAAAGLAVTLGISMPKNEQSRLNTYLASRGAPADQDMLLDGDFWRRPYQDGRSSRAMLMLVDQVRALRAQGLLINLVAYDTDDSYGSQRDNVLAQYWLKRRAEHPDEFILVLAGNAHVTTLKGAPWDKDYSPMGWHLAQADPTLKALDLSHLPGFRWACNFNAQGQLDCRVYRIAHTQWLPSITLVSPFLHLFPHLNSKGYHGVIYTTRLTPSLPATVPISKPK
ncbi:hypothetical protein ACN28E_40130 [Archangium lansingense]|uniref:hypothetical protein n=1 Tax=Archangium lansingense TaxID=2995310 RepID=UPI003B766E0E